MRPRFIRSVLMLGAVVAALAISAAPVAARPEHDPVGRADATHHVGDTSNLQGTPAVARLDARDAHERALKHRAMPAAVLASLLLLAALQWRRHLAPGGHRHAAATAPLPFLGRAPPRPVVAPYALT